MSVDREGRVCVGVEADKLWLMSVNRQGRMFVSVEAERFEWLSVVRRGRPLTAEVVLLSSMSV